MGYETRIHVVKEHTFRDGSPRCGEEIASLDLCKCGDGAVADLISEAIKKQHDQRPFALWARNPDKQGEGVEVVRAVIASPDYAGVTSLSLDELTELANHLEDGKVERDRYDDPLGVIPIREFIEALQSDWRSEKYRRYGVALAMLKSIVKYFPSEVEDGSLVVVTYGH